MGQIIGGSFEGPGTNGNMLKQIDLSCDNMGCYRDRVKGLYI